MRKIETWGYLFLLLTILFLSGCAKASHITDHGISEQEAIDIALKLAAMSRPEMSGSLVAPSNVQAEQMRLAEAIKRISKNSDAPAGYTPDNLVWLVTMDGLWLDEFGSPTDSATQEPYHHFITILDAKSGLEIESAAHP
ncbi:MAG TPA: hypothetical protein VK249_16490 [Anaerolineales bacterium]|nr:hypothetical protein [Anaerolineales bacterium]